MNQYKPVPVDTARQIASDFDKQIVVILAYDNAAKLTHTTTYGVPEFPQAKDLAAEWGEIVTKAIGADTSHAVVFEDFRATDEAKARSFREKAIAALNMSKKVLNDEYGGESELSDDIDASFYAVEMIDAALKLA